MKQTVPNMPKKQLLVKQAYKVLFHVFKFTNTIQVEKKKDTAVGLDQKK